MKVLKSISSFLIALVLLFSSLGVTVSRHYCMGLITDESYYSPVEGCDMQMQGSTCTSEHSLSRSFGCCEYEYIAIPGLQVVNSLDQEIELETPQFYPSTIVFLIDSSFDFNRTEKENFPQNSDPPPRIHKNVLVDFQRFLI